jgi:hypothetical protein
MKLLRVRFTMRRMLVAVAIAGILFWGGRLWRLAASYRVEAERYANRLSKGDVRAFFDRIDVSPEESERQMGAWRDQMVRRRSHYQAMKIKYEHAARNPWLAVAPDPPEPK